MKPFHPAIYICADCHVEHYGDRQRLPVGWIRCAAPNGHDAVRCGNCADQIAQRHIYPRAPRPLDRPTAGMAIGILAAGFNGALMRASNLPRREARR